MPVSITYWRDVLRKLTTTEMDDNFENLANAIENAGLSPTMPEGQIYIGDNTNTASLETLDTSIVPETTDKNYQTDNQKLFNDATSSIQTQFDNINNLTPAYNLSAPTGVCEGGILSINADPTKFNISDGFGYIADLYTDADPANATITKVSWSGLTAQTVTNLATSTVTFVYIKKGSIIPENGEVYQTTVQPTEETLRDYIYAGQLGHSNFTSISTAISQPSVAQSPMSQLRDLWTELKYLNDGNIISANGANLSLNKSNGNLIGLGLNFENAIKTPNKKNFPAQTLATIRRRTQTGGTGTSTTLDVLNYDLGGTVTTITGTKAQNQRVFILPSGNLIVQYGQTLYNSLTDAVQGIETETFIELENVKTGQLIAIISVTSNCTSLQDTSRARIKNVGKFGEVNVGAGASSVSTLQQAYTNSTTPEILTDTTRGALSVRRGTASDTDTVFDVQNGAGTETFSVDGNGLIKSAQATASTPAFFSSVKGIISATGALLGTWFQTLTADTNPVDADTIVVNDSTASFEAKKTTLLQLWTNYLRAFVFATSLTTNRILKWDGSKLVDSDNYDDGNYFYNTKKGFRTNTTSDVDLYLETTGASATSNITLKSAGVRTIQAVNGSNVIQYQIFDDSSWMYVQSRKNLIVYAIGGTGNHNIDIRTAGNTYYTNATHTFLPNTGSQLAELNSNGLAIGASAINARAQLELQSTSKGFLPNVLTTAQRDAVSWVAGDAGMIIYNSTTNKHQGWNGTTWNDMY